MADNFVFNEEYQILICRQCGTSIPPSTSAQTRHLRLPQHSMGGVELQTLLDLFGSYGELHTPSQPPPSQSILCPSIPHLRIHNVYTCRICTNVHFIKNLQKMRKHISTVHHILPKLQNSSAHYRATTVQTLYSEKKNIHYFEVLAPEKHSTACDIPPKIHSFFGALASKRNEEKQLRASDAGIISGFEAHKSEVVPWLQRTGIADHLQGLPRDRVKESFQLLPSANAAGSLLNDMLEATSTILDRAYSFSQHGPQTQLTYGMRLAMTRMDRGSEGSTHMFLETKSADTLKIYYRYWKQFVVYYFNLVIDSEREAFWFPQDIIPGDVELPAFGMSPAEGNCLADLQTAHQFARTAEQKVETLVLSLPVLFRHILGYRTGPNSFRSPLVSFAAMLAVKPTTSTWKESGDFSSNLSGIIWVSQLLLFYYCVESTEKEDMIDNPNAVYDKLCQVFDKSARQDSQTALGQLLNWRDLLLMVSKNTMTIREAIWDPDYEALSYDGGRLEIKNVTSIIEKEFMLAQKILHQDLLLSGAGVELLTAAVFEDNLRHVVPGQSLFDICGGSVPKHALEQVILNNSQYHQHFLCEDPSGAVIWRSKAIDVYEATVQKFLHHLLALVHLSSGQPLRAPEILSTKWRNTQNQARSIFVLHRHVMMRVNYHKGLQHTGKYKDNMRFLPTAIGELVLNFLAHVQPLREQFLQQAYPGETLSPYLWEDARKVWKDGAVSTALKRASARSETVSLHVSNWRQFTVAIVKAKFGKDSDCFDLCSPEDEAKDDDGIDDIGAMNLQRNHATRTANMSYANQHSSGGIIDGFIQRSFRASKLWDELFSIQPTLAKHRKRFLEEEDEEELPVLKKLRAGHYQVRRKYTSRELLLAARTAYGNPHMTWKSPKQIQALNTVMSDARAIVAVLPTGAGKSLLFMLPCTLPGAKTTILILPLISLRNDMIRRLRELRISTAVWESGADPSATLVIVSAEAASTKSFLGWAQSLVAMQRLDRIVVDECHLIITASDYRPSMRKLSVVRSLNTQFVYLTATLPLSMENEFIQNNYLQAARIIRASADRPNIIYRQKAVKKKSEDFFEDCADVILDASIKHAAALSGTEDIKHSKALVYCQTLPAAKLMGDLLGCATYTSESGTPEVKAKIIVDWLDDSGSYFLVATSALSAGFDYPYVRQVWHVDVPSQLVDYAQESGRAGRDGEAAYSAILFRKGWKPASPNPTPMETFITTRDCLRKVMSAYLDSVEHRTLQCPLDRHQCQNCLIRRAKPQPTLVTEPPPSVQQHDEFQLSGAEQIAIRRRQDEEMLSRYEDDLEFLKGTCVLCRLYGGNFEHALDHCTRKERYILFKAKAKRMADRDDPWMKDYTACFTCFLPQCICGNQGQRGLLCHYKDLLLPWCFFMWRLMPGTLAEYDKKGHAIFDNTQFLNWFAEPAKLGEEHCVKGVCFMAEYLRKHPLY